MPKATLREEAAKAKAEAERKASALKASLFLTMLLLRTAIKSCNCGAYCGASAIPAFPTKVAAGRSFCTTGYAGRL